MPLTRYGETAAGRGRRARTFRIGGGTVRGPNQPRHESTGTVGTRFETGTRGFLRINSLAQPDPDAVDAEPLVTGRIPVHGTILWLGPPQGVKRPHSELRECSSLFEVWVPSVPEGHPPRVPAIGAERSLKMRSPPGDSAVQRQFDIDDFRPSVVPCHAAYRDWAREEPLAVRRPPDDTLDLLPPSRTGGFSRHLRRTAGDDALPKRPIPPCMVPTRRRLVLKPQSAHPLHVHRPVVTRQHQPQRPTVNGRYRLAVHVGREQGCFQDVLERNALLVVVIVRGGG